MKNYNSKLRITPFLIILFGVLFFARDSLAATYYVSTTGSDSNSGSQSAPWKTIQKAANTIVAGDTVIVNAGTYNERVTASRSGSSGSMITFKASGTVNTQGFYVTGNYIRVEGFTAASAVCDWGGVIDVSGSGCIIANNIIQDSSKRAGILLRASSNGCTAIGNIIRRVVLNGVSVNGKNHLIENNDISDMRCEIGGCSWGDANGIEFHGDGHIIRGNYIHDITFENNPGYSPHIDGFQTFQNADAAAATNCLIEKNHIYLMNEAKSGVDTLCAFMIHHTTNLIIRNNLVEARSGITTTSNPYNYNLKIYNNVFRSKLSFNPDYWPRAVQLNGVSTAEMYNNIAIDFSYAHFIVNGVNSGLSYDYNLMWNSDGSAPKLDGYAVQPHDKQRTDPKFVSNFNDLRLQSTSPCKDAGATIAGITDDYAGVLRPQGSAYDIGAFEYVSGSGDTTPPAAPTGVKVI